MLKLMIVDDELLMRIGIRSLVDWEAYGFQLSAESINGKEALEIAQDLRPDLIITDIRMPVMDGLQMIREASKINTKCQFVILSNFDEFGYVKEALQLGAIDYLIKSEITPESLADILTKVKDKHKATNTTHSHSPELSDEISQSLTLLKESFFKDLISGLLHEQEATTKMKQYQIAIQSKPLIVVKLRIDQFAAIRKKYVEKDERLLRFSIVNILEEIIPKRWSKEVVIETSSEYLLIANTFEQDEINMRTEITKLCSKVQQTLKDFMNISITIGVSSIQPHVLFLKKAYQEADLGIRYSFFKEKGHIIFAEDIPPNTEVDDDPGKENNQTDQANQAKATQADQAKADQAKATQANQVKQTKKSCPYELTLANKQSLQQAFESQNEPLIISVFDKFREQLHASQRNEQTIREAYFRLTEHTSSFLSTQPHIAAPLPYELLLGAENWEDLHHIALDYAKKGIDDSRKPVDERNYIDMAVEMINLYFPENISLQSVAGEINVNPSYLSRLFKQEMGENFISYLTRVRIDKAKLYLGNRNYKIYEVADKVGYHNYTYFSKIFKKVVGVSPEDYRCGHHHDKSLNFEKSD